MTWSKKWLLKFHPDKCVCMGIGVTANQVNRQNYNMDGHILKFSECEKDIGVFIDSRLNFETHINEAIKKANRILAITRKTFESLDQTTFRYIFKGMVRPHLEYGAPLWSPHLIKYKEIIENVQRRATKLVPGLSNLSYPERLRKLRIPTLAYRRVRGDMIQVFKLLNDGYDPSLPKLLEPIKSNLRGHEQKLYIERSEKPIRTFSFTMRVRKIWNSLPSM